MNILLFFYIIFLLLLISSAKSFSYYSKLLDSVNIEKVNVVVYFLPQRKDTNLLNMYLSMKNKKEEHSLSEAESVFLIYNWIAKNIEYDCTTINKEKSDDALNTYNTGKGTYAGISDLFNNMCKYMNIKSYSIPGLVKKMYLYPNETITIIDYIWNYIEINNTYYLIDVSSATGFCNYDKFIEVYSDVYFGTNPELFIRSHFPKNNTYQFLSKYITKEQFVSWAFLTDDFFSFGIKSISPDLLEINGTKETKFNITFDKSIKGHNFVEIIQYLNGEVKMQNPLYSKYDKNGWVEIITDLSNENISYYAIGDEKYQNSYTRIVIYKILHPIK